MGASVECWPAGVCHPLPVFSTFVLTSDTGLKIYGAAVIFYEDYDESLLTEEQHSLFSRVSKFMYREALANTPSAVPTLHQNRCICFLSRWPFFDAMRGLLLYIYRISVSGPQPVPVER
jgi:DENN domain-containing protein 4